MRSGNSYIPALCCTAALVFLLSACSIPNLESPRCVEARDAVKKFYSFHFGNDMVPSNENLRERQGFLTDRYFSELMSAGIDKRDVFTNAEVVPKTFKIGKCQAPNENTAGFQVQLYWRDDFSTVQKEVRVDLVKTGDKWLIDKVSN